MRSALKILVVIVTAAIFFWLAGCASQPPQTITIEKPVLIQSPPEFLPVPAGMFDGCIPPALGGATNGDLLLHDHAEMAYAACLLAHLNAIKVLR